MKKVWALGGALLLLSGCITTEVSPLIAGKPGIVTVLGEGNTESFLDSVTFIRPPVSGERASICLSQNVDGLEAAPVQDRGVSTASGTSSYYMESLRFKNDFRFTLTVNPREASYRFSRLMGKIRAVSAHEQFNPEAAYAEMEVIVNRIDTCLREYQ
jgi:hypothetical protein